MTHKSPVTSGAIISSFCFGGVGLWLLSEAGQADPGKAIIIYVCAVACLAGAFRIPISSALSRLKGE